MIRFGVNGKEVRVEGRKIEEKAVLGNYLRDELGMKGLQMFCKQGGCGSCTVVISYTNQASGEVCRRTVNSCLLPLCSVDGMHVTTVEGVGSIKAGLHPIQDALVREHGTQCGFCSPGMVMSMYGLSCNKSVLSPRDIEDGIDGNLCRCTGYRPILNAFQLFACQEKNNCNKEILNNCPNFDIDIEDINFNGTSKDVLKKSLILRGGATWIRVSSLETLYNVFQEYKNQRKVRLVRGNTSAGIYPEFSSDVYVDISQVSELLITTVTRNGITIGGAVSISDFMMVLEENKELSSSYGAILSHLKRVAHPQVRNLGSVSGNLIITRDHPDFISDIVALLMAAEAKITIGSAYSDKEPVIVSIEELLKMEMDDKVIIEIHVPVLPVNSHFVSQKVALRRANAHAVVNTAFKFELSDDTDYVNRVVIVYGGIKPFPQRATECERLLLGKSFKDPKVFEACLQALNKELVPDSSFGQKEYRSFLVNTLFYKSILSFWALKSLPPWLQTNFTNEERPISSGYVSFDEGDLSEYPVSLPVPKLTAISQVTGEVEYLDDIKIGNSWHAKLVVSTVANAKIKSIDPSKALAKKGVMSFLSADTITADGYCNFISDYECVFAPKKVDYCGQIVGVIVAKTMGIAEAAANLVEVKYIDVKKPILTIKDAMESNSFHDSRSFSFEKGNMSDCISKSQFIIEGQVEVGHQNHFHLETQRSLCVPGEEGCMTVYSSTQNPSKVQQCVAIGLNRPQHKVNVTAKHIGGAFGAKINRSTSVAMACAMAADKLQRPVRLLLDISTNMQLVGGRNPYLCRYKVAARENGRIDGIEIQLIMNQGAHFDFEHPDMSSLLLFIDGVYNVTNWKIEGKVAKTNLPACTYMRGPVFVETTVMIETIIEHVSKNFGLQPQLVREINMYKKGEELLCGQKVRNWNADLVTDAVKVSSEYENRLKEVQAFNKKSQWVKRGISLVPIKFAAVWEAQARSCLINIHADYSISLYHSGCEIGQGLDVKVAQVAAMSLGSLIEDHLDMKSIYVHSTTTIVANNTASTGGSVTSELCAKAAQEACNKLVNRLQSISVMLSSTSRKPTWPELISKAQEIGIDLQARGRIHPAPSPSGICQYFSCGAGVTEVEVDILTGESCVRRADVLLDCGKSLNPAIDIGQIQGAFVQGLGYHLSEKFVYDKHTGKLLTDSTWEYKPPSSKDIPIIFNVSLLPDSSNPAGFLRSKFSGEPPYAIACSALFAVRQAIAAAKADWGDDTWFWLPSPATVADISLITKLPLSKLNLYDLQYLEKASSFPSLSN